MPFAGYRNYYDASLSNQGTYGDYWSSSPYGDGNPDYARRIGLGMGVDASNGYYRTNGYSVRCFKNSYVAPTISYSLELHANGGVVAEDTLETDGE